MGILRLAVSTILIACLLNSVPAYSQPSPLITFTKKNITLREALDEIHKQTNYTYAGESIFTQYSHRISISVRNAPLSLVLDSCFRDQPFTYEIVGTAIVVQARPVRDQTVHGWIFDEKKQPLEGVTILVRGEPMTAAVSRVSGEFSIHMHFADDRLVFSSVGYEMQELMPKEGEDAVVILREKIGELSDVVVVHNGYTEKTLKASTGSSDVVGTALISRRVSTSLMDRIDGVTSSVLFNKNIQANTNQSSITIRGRSTIFANPNPLIVIDNFPYYGDIGNINPEDVESITILKDAAAASIWGAASGNGVIVITTKKGKLNQAPKWSFTTSQTVGEKPDLYYQPVLSSADYIDIQQFLFRNKFYNGALSPFQHGAITPAVEIFDAASKGTLSSTDSATQINLLKGQDKRRDLSRYFYQHSLNSQYALNVTGGGAKNNYYLSGGFDENRSNLVRNLYKRATLTGSNTYLVLQDRMEVTTGVSFASSKFYNNNSGVVPGYYPYAKYADARGNPLPINIGFKNSYIDTVGGGQLLDWHYVPLNELKNSDNTTNLADYRINVGIKYAVRKGLDIRAYYQYGWGDSIGSNYQSIQTYFARNLINSFAQYKNGLFTFPVPQGGILDETRNTYAANSARLQVNYQDSLFRRGLLNATAGAEVRDIEGESRRTRLYGYEKGVGSSRPVNYDSSWQQFPNFGTSKIPYLDLNGNTAERYISYYVNGDYTYLGRYTLSASARWDESNLFGVKANQRGVPLWSVGGAWFLSREKFYKADWLSFLKLRVTDGFNGNIDRSTSAFTTAYFNQGGNSYGVGSATITNPANPSLRWEKINIFNAGLDFSFREDRFGGSIDYFIKEGEDLIGESPLDPTVGLTTFRSNVANMSDHGIDFSMHANNRIGNIHWNSILLFSYVEDKVTVYKEKIGPVYNYLGGTSISPIVGRPLYSLFALRWMGLDSKGNPQGLLDGKVSTQYGAMLGSGDLNDLVYMGPLTPRGFGSWRNNLSWRQWGLSWNIVYKLGYVFQRSSILYSYVFTGGSPGSPDYERRWQNPGDEANTNVPSMVYSLDRSRDNFYQNSTVLTEKGDHIRLQDIQLSYDLVRSDIRRLPVSRVKIYLYANNIGIIWKANHAGLDPDYVTGVPNPRTLAIGLKTDF